MRWAWVVGLALAGCDEGGNKKDGGGRALEWGEVEISCSDVSNAEDATLFISQNRPTPLMIQVHFCEGLAQVCTPYPEWRYDSQAGTITTRACYDVEGGGEDGHTVVRISYLD